MKKSEKNDSNRIIAVMLKPLVAYCLKSDISFQTVITILKHAFVTLAVEEMRRNEIRTNVSRVSVRTGLHRRDVTRILNEGVLPLPADTMSGRLILQWSEDKRFRTRSGKPRTLPLDDCNGSFQDLVQTVGTDLSPGTILFELERQGYVEQTNRGVKLLKKEHSVREDVAAGLQFFVRDAETLLDAIEENIYEAHALPHLHVRTEFDNIAKPHVPAIRAWLLNEGAKFHKRARAFIAQYDKDINPNLRQSGGAKIVLGTFSHAKTE